MRISGAARQQRFVGGRQCVWHVLTASGRAGEGAPAAPSPAGGRFACYQSYPSDPMTLMPGLE